jgi:hypothetical protein
MLSCHHLRRIEMVDPDPSDCCVICFHFNGLNVWHVLSCDLYSAVRLHVSFATCTQSLHVQYRFLPPLEFVSFAVSYSYSPIESMCAVRIIWIVVITILSHGCCRRAPTKNHQVVWSHNFGATLHLAQNFKPRSTFQKSPLASNACILRTIFVSQFPFGHPCLSSISSTKD